MDGDRALRFDVMVSGFLPGVGEELPNGERPAWPPLSHTLIYGDTEAALVDPPISVAQAAAVGDWVESKGRRLSFIYLTHWHPDHWLSTGELVKRFPGVVVYTTRETRRRMGQAVSDGQPPALFRELFPGQLPAPVPLLAEVVPEDGFAVDGHDLIAVEVGHSDTEDTTVLHVPSLRLVAAGDVVYNNVHQLMSETPDGGLEAWHRALEIVDALKPVHVVAGHKDVTRDDAPSTIGETRQYLDEIGPLLTSGLSRSEFFWAVLGRYPDRIGPSAVWLTADRVLK